MTSQLHIRRRFSWSELPPELLSTIADHLNSNSDDLQHFRAVCKNWRSSIPPPFLRLNPNLPYKTPHLCSPLPFNDSCIPFLIVSTSVYLLRPPRRHSTTTTTTPWLIAVEQSNPDKVHLLHPLTHLPVETLPENFPQILTNFSALELSRGFDLRYLDGITPVLNRKGLGYCVNKVVLWPNPNMKDVPGIGDSSLMVLHKTGDLVCLRLSDFRDYKSIVYASVSKFDDIIIWKGFVFAVDRSGRLYGIEYSTRKVVTVLVAVSIFKGCNEKRKRLLVSDGEVYLLVRDSTVRWLKFKVYRLNEKIYQWEEVMGFGDRILFVSFDTCFFAWARDLPGFGGNCIVYPKGCFPLYTSNYNADDNMFDDASMYFEVGVYNYGDDGIIQQISSWRGFSDVFWPPPRWICEDAALSQWEYDDEAMQLDFSGQDAPDVSCNRVTPSEIQGRKQMDNPSSNLSIGLAAEEQCEEYSSTIDHHNHIYAEADIREAITGDSVLAIGSISPITKSTSTVDFQGVVLRSDLMPILQKIWEKHGDITEGSVVCHGGILAGALESLARMVLILINSSGRSLNNSQAHDLSCVLHDLQNIHFRVDWLVPFVENALQRHKSKPMLEVAVELEKAKSQAEEMRTQLQGLLNETQNTLEGLEEKKKLVLGTVDAIGLDEWLGKGIF